MKIIIANIIISFFIISFSNAEIIERGSLVHRNGLFLKNLQMFPLQAQLLVKNGRIGTWSRSWCMEILS